MSCGGGHRGSGTRPGRLRYESGVSFVSDLVLAGTTVAGGTAEVPDCVAAKGAVCGFIWRVTHVGWLAESSEWVLVKPLRIGLIVLLALVTRWAVHRAIKRLSNTSAQGATPALLRPLRERMPAGIGEVTGLLSERRRQRAATIGSLLRSVSSAVIFTIAIMLVLGELGIDLAPLLASAGIVGVALGFGAQALVKDVISGIFMLLEDQYGVGDIVDLGEASGTVEGVGLRVTTVRDVQGVLWYVRNGEVIRVGNRSQGWANVVLDVPIGFGTPVEDATAVMARVAASVAGDELWRTDLIEPPEVLGVEQITIDGPVVRMTAKTTTDGQWRLARELRRQLADALDAAGISARISAGRVYVRSGGTAASGDPGTAGAT